MNVLLIDSYNMIHRSRFGWKKGEHSITFNFFRSLKSEIDRHSPDVVYIVSEGMPKHRMAQNSEYKGNRVKIKDEGFHRQKRDIFELCKLLPITFIRHEDYECDDVIGHLCTEVHSSDNVVICSSDSDFIQLISERVALWNPLRKKFIDPWPVDYVTWKSLRGDKTDNVAGIKGVGDKTAHKLASNPDMLKSFLVGEKLAVFNEAKAQIRLAKICDNKFEQAHFNFNADSLKREFIERDFKSIVEKGWSKWMTTWERVDGSKTAVDV